MGKPAHTPARSPLKNLHPHTPICTVEWNEEVTFKCPLMDASGEKGGAHTFDKARTLLRQRETASQRDRDTEREREKEILMQDFQFSCQRLAFISQSQINT